MSIARAAEGSEGATASCVSSREIVAAGSAAWPTLVIDESVFQERLTRLFSHGFSASECVYPADLFFAVACASGDAEALRLFEQAFVPNMMRSAAHLLGPTVRADEVRQALRVKLFVRDGDAEPKISQYMGRGPLAGWLRIVAVRTVLSLRRAAEPSTPREREEDELLGGIAAQGGDPELEHLRGRYKEAFQGAFHDALMSLDVAERNVLRLHHVEGLGIDELAPIFKIHRATAARRLTKAREEISERTRTLLVERLRLSESECSSIMGMILSQLDVSIVRVLSARDE
jgi:RNA polymerase sigma-70 factor (ECF subfamily)